MGADDCVIRNRDGLVTEASNSNVFFVIDGRLITPGDRAGNLRGITKATIHKACAENGLDVAECDIRASDLTGATECFVTSATREVMPVVRLRLEDGSQVEFPPGGGKITNRASEFYGQFVERYVRENASKRLI